jgi:hypothetical protein
MEQLKLYITLLRHNCLTIAHQTLEELHNSNRVFFLDMDTSTIYMDGDWWSDFINSHTLDICETIMLHLRTRFKANHIHLVYRNRPTVGFIWNDNAKMYLGDGGY